MKELMQISQAVIDALSEAGVQAMAAFPPERVKQYDGAVAAAQPSSHRDARAARISTVMTASSCLP